MQKSKEVENNPARMRIDKWLHVARLFKTRSKAVAFCQARHVKVNGKTVKPSHSIKIGDNISIQLSGRNRTFDVVSFAPRRLSAKDANELYVEHLPKISEESSEFYELFMKQERQRQREMQGKGRPTKKERRQIDQIKGK